MNYRMSARLRAALISIIFLSIFTMILVSLWLFVQGRILRSEARKKMEISVGLVADMSRRDMFEGRVLNLGVIADQAQRPPDITRVLIADRTGSVIADSRHEAYGLKPAIIRQVLRTGDMRIQEFPDRWVGATSVRIETGQPLGAVAVEITTESVLTAQRNARSLGIIIALLGIALGAVVAFLSARILTQPLENLLAGIRRVQAGRLESPVPVTGSMEVTEIGQAFNEMTDAVQERIRRLELLSKMAVDLSGSADIHEAAGIISNASADILSAISFLWVIDPIARRLVETPPRDEKAHSFVISASSDRGVVKAFLEGRILRIGAGNTDFPQGSELAEGLTVRSAIILPLVSPEGIAGVLVIAEPRGSNIIRAEDEALARAIAGLAAPVVMYRLRITSHSLAARTLQKLLSPGLPVEGFELDAEVWYHPAEEIVGLGGDFYDFIPLERGRWGIVVGDATGKGFDAARQTVTAKYVIRSFMLEYEHLLPALQQSNRTLVTQQEPGQFITIFTALIDPSKRNLTFTGAGHPPSFLVRKSTGELVPLYSQALPLGVVTDEQFKEDTITWESGDLFCAYTDGIIEAKRGHELFGEEGLTEILKAHHREPVMELGNRIMNEALTFIEGGPKDDIILLLVRLP